jgi:hypothetical protein
MAILENLGLAVSIKGNGEKLTEYDDSNLAGVGAHGNSTEVMTCAKYIEAIDNQKYSIALEVTEKYKWPMNNQFCLIFDVKIDGKWVTRRRANKPANSSHRRWSSEIHGCHERGPQGSRLHQFMFSCFDIGAYALSGQ